MSETEVESTDTSDPRLVVGVGASAGGLDALQRFFSSVEKGSGIAWVVVQHLDPDRETMMPEILGRQVSLEVTQVTDETPLEPDRIYAIPPNATLTVEGGMLRVAEPEEARGRRVPIDIFFSSLAADLGPYAVCVVLSGAGSDGATGLRRIKEMGGMAIAQTPETAKYDGMPRSAASTGLVDHVLPPEAMCAVIREYADHLHALERDGGLERLQQQADAQIQQVTTLLREHTGHDFSGYKRSTLSRRIQRRVQVTRSPSVEKYLERLRADHEEVGRLLRDLLIGVTKFFRDEGAFDALQREVFSRLAAAGSDIRIWVPGCATGQEPYSLAIQLCEALEEHGTRPRVQLFATDIDQEALAVARAGRYGREIEDEVGAERLERYFSRRPDGWEVRPSVREMCVFSPHNLVNDPPFSRLDLVSCRNLLIYLHRDLQNELLGLFHFALRPGGYLFLGPSESTTGAPELYSTVDKKHRIFRARERAVRRSVHLPALEPWRRSEPFRPRPTPAGEPRLESRIRRLVLERYAPVSVLVDEDHQVVLTTGPTGRYLELPVGEASLGLFELAEPGLRAQLRTLLRQARKDGEASTDAAFEREGKLMPLRLRAIRVEGTSESSPLWLILFEEREEVAAVLEPAVETAERGEPEIAKRLRDELRFVREQLQSTVEELETSNEELKSSNEELLSMNEELQSTNEELQTSEEELQSRNEELETVNYELQQKIEEVNRAHADLQNLFESTAVATLFLDRRLIIKRFTPACENLFRLRPGDAGRNLRDITARFGDLDLLAEARAVLESLQERHLRVVTDDGRTFQLRIGPYTTLDGEVEGLVLTFVEVSALLASQERERELAAAIESAHDAVYVRGLDGVIRSWNPAAAALYGHSEEEAVGMSFFELVPAENRAELAAWEARVRAGESVGPVDTRRRTQEGQEVDVSLTMAPVRDEDGEIAAIVAVARDVSERVREQEERERLAAELARRVDELAAADARKDEFLAMLSHELRNPLAPMFNAVSVLRRDDLPAERRFDLLDMIERQGRQLSRLVDDLLDVSRITRGKITLRREVVNLRSIVEHALETHRPQLERLDQTARTSLPEDPVWVDGDVVRLQQVVGNLIHNASKFSPSRSSIDVRVGRDGDDAVIEIADQGIGLDEDLAGRMFELFAQGDRSLARSEGGLGVGLTTVKRLVEMHGGTVAAESAGLDRGSVFRIRLPPSSPPRRDSDASEERPAHAVDKRKVLVVEDNADAAQALAALLRHSGHRCWVAGDGVEALDLFAEHEPEVVLLDIGLPRMDGFEVAEKIRLTEAGRRAILVALTGYGQEDMVDRALGNGFDHHLLKPADPAEIERLVSAAEPA